MMEKENNNRINSYESASFPCGGMLCRVDAHDGVCSQANSSSQSSTSLDQTTNCNDGMLQKDESCFSKTQWKNRYKKLPICINCQQAAALDKIDNPHQLSNHHHPHSATDIVVASSLCINDNESLKQKEPEESCIGNHYNKIEIPVKLDDEVITLEKSKVDGNSNIALDQISLIEDSTTAQIPNTEQDMNKIELTNLDSTPVGDVCYSEKATQPLDEEMASSSIDFQAIVDSARLDNDVVDVNLDRSTNVHNKNTDNDQSNEYEATFADDKTSTIDDTTMPLHDQTSSQLKGLDGKEDTNSESIQPQQSSLIDSIPRKSRFLKRKCNNNSKDESSFQLKKSYRPTLYDNDDDQEDDEQNASDYDDKYESLEKMKEHILGRKLVTSASPFNDTNLNRSNIENECISPIQKIDDSLRMELSCPICHDILYRPVSLLCGHSFCYKCIHWWMVRSKTDHIQDRDNQRLNNHVETNGSNNCLKCPTCRSVVLVPNDEGSIEESISLSVNRALEAALGVLFPNETKTRYQIDCKNREKAVAGENEGRHTKGFVELISIDDITESLKPVFQSMLSLPHHTKSKKILMIHSMKARRSLILDGYDQRMRLCLALYGKPAIVKASKKINNGIQSDDEEGNQSNKTGLVLNIDICLLHLEEEEAEEGIPFRILKGSDDENFISVRDPNYFSMIEATMIAQTKPKNSQSVGSIEEDDNHRRKPDHLITHTQPVTRTMLGEPGIVTLSIDIWKYLDQIDTDTQHIEHTIVLQFCHTETNAQLNLHLPFSVENEEKMKTVNKHNRSTNKDTIIIRSLARQRKDFKDASDSDNEDEDSFEDDGFVVNDDADTDDDDIFDACVEDNRDNDQVDEDDSEGCCICHGHGDLIVCDGGDNQDKSKGCDRSFHINCIGLHFIPPGDWICERCAMNDLGLETGTQGYEFPAVASDDNSNQDDNEKNDSDNSESKKEISLINRKRFVLDSSGDADEDLEDMMKYHNEKRSNEEESIASDNSSTGNKRSRFSPDISENTDVDSETSSPIKRTFVRKKTTSRQIFCDDDDSDEND